MVFVAWHTKNSSNGIEEIGSGIIMLIKGAFGGILFPSYFYGVKRVTTNKWFLINPLGLVHYYIIKTREIIPLLPH